MQPLEYSARLRDKDLSPEPLDARVLLTQEGLRVVVSEREVDRELPWQGMRLRQSEGGALECSRKGVTVSVVDPEFRRALESVGGNDLANQLARLEGERVANPLLSKLGCLAMALMSGYLLYRVPGCFNRTSEALADSIPYSVDEQIGDFAESMVPVDGQERSDEVLRDAVQQMLDRLAPHRSLPEAEFQFRIVQNDLVNAFALPGGHIVVFTGLLEEAEGPEEVIGVLAHEISHVTLRHGIHQIVKALGITAAATLALGDLSGVEQLIVEVIQKGHSRDAEAAADAEAVRMLLAAEIDPEGLARFFERLVQVQSDAGLEIPEWLSTHPESAARARRVRELAQERRPGYEFRGLDLDWAEVQSVLDQ